MGRRAKGERVLGPYKHGRGWRIFEIGGFDDQGKRTRTQTTFATKREAQRTKDLIEAQIVCDDQTTDTALEAYEKYLKAKGNKGGSIIRTKWSILRFFPEPLPLWGLTRKKCEKLYRDLSEGEHALSVDSHRNMLAEVKTFLNWCVERHWLGKNPAAHIKGIGRRKKRKPQLRLRDMRKWYEVATELAADGDEGAIAALMALLLGLRASEITKRECRDLDEDRRPGDLLVIDEGKTAESSRTIEVPDPLRQALVDLVGRRSGVIFATSKGRNGYHERGWVRAQVHRICDKAEVDRVTAHAMRGALSTIALDRGTAGHAVAATLGHADIKTTKESYAKPGSAESGARKQGLVVLGGGKQ